VKTTLFILLELTEIDKIIEQLKQEKIEIPGQIKNHENEIELAQKQLNAQRDKITQNDSAKKEIESFIQEKNAWIVDRENRIKEIQTNKEYQAALKEISMAKKEIKDKEAALQALSPNNEELSKGLEVLNTSNTQKIETSGAEIKSMQEKLQKIGSMIEEEAQKRKIVIEKIENKDMLKHYENVHVKVTPVMSKIDRGACSECGHRVPPQTMNLMHSSPAMQYCYRCKRILYFEELLEEKKA
jgi:predicted  nucleic acid-binding Zn-ribbon protein